MIYRAYQVASIMHIFPSVDIIVYDITRGSGLLPGNKAYHQTSPGTLVKHAALTARGHALAPRAARSSLHPHPRIVTNPRSQPSPPPNLTAENIAFSCPITALVSRYGTSFSPFFSFSEWWRWIFVFGVTRLILLFIVRFEFNSKIEKNSLISCNRKIGNWKLVKFFFPYYFFNLKEVKYFWRNLN